MDIIQSLNNVFIIACDSYGLTSIQIDNLMESINIISDSINGFNVKNKVMYIDSYNAITHVLGSGQKNGLFDLETASEIFKALVSIKQHITESEVISSDILDKNNKYLHKIIKNKVLSKCIYSNVDLKRINVSLSEIEKMQTIDGDYVKNYNTILNAINKAQSKGKFTFQQANSVFELITSVKTNVILSQKRFTIKQSKETSIIKNIEPEPEPEPKKNAKKVRITDSNIVKPIIKRKPQ